MMRFVFASIVAAWCCQLSAVECPAWEPQPSESRMELNATLLDIYLSGDGGEARRVNDSARPDDFQARRHKAILQGLTDDWGMHFLPSYSLATEDKTTQGMEALREEIDALRKEVASLREEVSRLRKPTK